MASLQVVSRLATPAFAKVISPACALRVSQITCGPTARDDGDAINEIGSAASTVFQQGSWAKFSGFRDACLDRGRCRARLVETEAPLAARPSESMRSVLQGSFETEAMVGRVECNNRGCRPIYDERDSIGVLDDERAADEDSGAMEVRAAVYTSRSVTKDMEIRPKGGFSLDFAEFLNEMWMEKTTATKYFELALRKNPNDARILLHYAHFSWKTLGDLDKADDLFTRALEESPNDADAHASYALFLWQLDE